MGDHRGHLREEINSRILNYWFKDGCSLLPINGVSDRIFSTLCSMLRVTGPWNSRPPVTKEVKL